MIILKSFTEMQLLLYQKSTDFK